MSTHTIEPAARRDARRVMNGALLRVATVAALSVVFALIHCVAPVDDPPHFARALAAETPVLAQTAAMGSLERGSETEAHVRPH